MTDIIKIRENLNHERYDLISDEQIFCVIDMYNAGCSYDMIAVENDISQKCVKRIAKAAELGKKKHYRSVRYNTQENFDMALKLYATTRIPVRRICEMCEINHLTFYKKLKKIKNEGEFNYEV